MKIESDVKLETMPRTDETGEEYLRRLRQLALDAAASVLESIGAIDEARRELVRLRHSGATAAECNAQLDVVLERSRALGKAKYERAHIEYTLADAYVRANS